MVVGRARDQHAARLANALQPRRDIDAVAENVVALDQHVAEIDADAVDDALRLRRLGVALDHQLLDRDRAFDGGDDGGKLQQQPVARRLDDAPAEARHDRPRRLAMLAHRPRRPRLVLAHQARVADDVDGEDRGEAAGRRSLLGDAGLAQVFESRFELGEIRWVVALRRPGDPEAGDGESRVEREAGLDRGMRFVEATELREGGGQHEIRCRIISVGLDRPSEPRGRLLITAEKVRRDAPECLPGMGIRVARTEAQGLADVSLCFLGATGENLAKSDKRMGAGKISIQLQRAFTFGDALRRAPGQYVDIPQQPVAARMVRD